MIIGGSLSTYAQDLLVNSSGDTLNIVTKKIELGFIHFSSQENQEVQLYPVNRIKIFIPEYFKQEPLKFAEESTLPPAMEPEVSDSTVQQTAFLPASVRIGANVGWGHMLASADPELTRTLKEHYKGLRNGLVFGASVDIFTHRFFGLGAEYLFFTSSHDLHDFEITVPSEAFTQTGTLTDQLFVHSIGLRALGRFHTMQNRFSFLPYLGANQIWYIDKQSFDGITARLNSTTFGFNGGFGFNFKVDQSFGIGLDINVLLGTLKSYTIGNANNSANSSREFENGGSNISRTNILAGLRWFL